MSNAHSCVVRVFLFVSFRMDELTPSGSSLRVSLCLLLSQSVSNLQAPSKVQVFQATRNSEELWRLIRRRGRGHEIRRYDEEKEGTKIEERSSPLQEQSKRIRSSSIVKEQI